MQHVGKSRNRDVLIDIRLRLQLRTGAGSTRHVARLRAPKVLLDEVRTRLRAAKPLAGASRGIQRQECIAHRQRVFEIWTSDVALVMTESATGQGSIRNDP